MQEEFSFNDPNKHLNRTGEQVISGFFAMRRQVPDILETNPELIDF